MAATPTPVKSIPAFPRIPDNSFLKLRILKLNRWLSTIIRRFTNRLQEERQYQAKIEEVEICLQLAHPIYSVQATRELRHRQFLSGRILDSRRLRASDAAVRAVLLRLGETCGCGPGLEDFVLG